MGNEMGNNNTSGLREEDTIVEEKSVQGLDRADDLKGLNHVVPATLDKDSQGKETEGKEENNMKTEGKKSPEDVARTGYEKEQNHDVAASEDKYVNGKDENDHDIIPVDKESSMQEAGYAEEGKDQDHLVPAAGYENTPGSETESASLEHHGLKSPCIEEQEHDEKDQDNSTICKVEEIPLKEGASIVETKAEASLDLAAGDESIRGNETESVSREHDGLASPCIKGRECDEKDAEQETSKDEVPSKEGASTDETNAEACLVPAGRDESTHGTETKLVLGDRDGMEHPCVDKQKQDEKEEDIIINDETEEQSSQEAASTNVIDIQSQLHDVAEDKATHENETDLVSSDPKETADLCSDNPKENEKVLEKSTQEAGYAEEAKGQYHLVLAAEDKNSQGNEAESPSLEHDGLESPHIEDPEHNEKEQDTSRDEIPLKEDASTDETNAEAGLVPAGEYGSTNGTETGLIFGNRDGMDCVDKKKHDDKEEDVTINDENEEQSSQEAACSDVANIESQLLVVEDKATNGNEKDLASSDPEGTVDLHGDCSEEHRKNPVDKEKIMQEAGHAEEEKGKDLLVPAAEDENNRGNETKPASLEYDSLASPCIKELECGEKKIDAEQDTRTNEIHTKEGASTDETNAEALLVPAGGDESTHQTETGMVFGDRDGMEYPCVNKQIHDEKGAEEDLTINDDAKDQSSQEAATTDKVDRQRGQLIAVVEDKTANGNETDLVSSNPEGTSDLHVDNPKEHEKEENNTHAEPQEKSLAKDNIEEKDLKIPAAEGEDCNNRDAEPASGDPMTLGDTLCNQILEGQEQRKFELDIPSESTEVDEKPNEVVGEGRETQSDSSLKNLDEMQKESNSEKNLSGRTQEIKNQNSMKEENEVSSNSISGAASSTSNDSVPQGPVVVLEAEDQESAENHTEELVFESNESVKSEVMIIPSLTSRDQENGFILDSSVSTDPVKSGFPDQSPEAGKGRVEFRAEEIVIEEVRSEGKFEVKDGDEPGNDVGTTTTVMTELPLEFGAKCNGELPSDMNSTKNDSFESQVEAVLSDEMQNILVEVSKSDDKGIGLTQEGASVKEESENGNSKQCDCQIQSGEESVEKSNGQGSEEGSKADDQSVFSPQFMMNGQSKVLENGHLTDASIDHQNEQQKDSQQEVQLVTDSADSSLTDQKNKEEEPEEKTIIEEIVENKEYSTKQAEAFLSPSPFLQGLPEKQMHDSDLESKKAENSNEYSMADVKQERSGEFSITEASSVDKNLTERIVVANGDYNQRETVGRLSIESNPENTNINPQMRKSPSFDLDLRIDARGDDSDQTPLLYQDKATIDSFSSQADVTDHGKPDANTDNGENPSQHDSTEAEEKSVTLERSDSEKSRTPFLGFMKEDEEADSNMLLNPKKQNNDTATKKTTAKVSVSSKVVSSSTTKGKVKRKPRTSLFGTCMCCATV